MAAPLDRHRANLAGVLKGGTRRERRAALLSFGGVERTKEAYRDIAWFRRLEELWQDARYGTRMPLKTPGFTAAAAPNPVDLLRN